MLKQCLKLSVVCALMTACVDDDTVEEPIQPEKKKVEETAAEEHKFSVDDKGHVKFAAEIVYFKFDDDTLTEEGRSRLDALATYLKDHKDKMIQIQGHCDERGSIEYNLALGDRRAASVRNYLTNLGIEGKRVKTISYGEEKPAMEGQSEDAWAKNRRADFVMTSLEAE